jgi:NAD(P)H-flavin reductase
MSQAPARQSANPYMPIPAPLVEVIDETPTIKTFVIEPAEPLPFRAGQFVELTLPGVGEAPFTPSSSPTDPKRLAITILKTGQVTDALHRVAAGETLGVRGPFGKGYPIEKLDGKEVLVIGGGVGLAPLRALLYALFDGLAKPRRIVIKYGARTPAELLFAREYERWSKLPKVEFQCTIDREAPGWDGHVGLVTTILAEEQLPFDQANCLAFSCGPAIMLRFVTMTLLGRGLSAEQIYLSMNRRMSCGIGKCGRCAVGPYLLCRDGPDMNYAKIQQYPNVFE